MSNQLFRKKNIETILRDAREGLSDSEGHHADLRRVLKVRDLTFFGIAAVIGTGVFTAIGSASFHGGPAVILLFAFTAIACSFAAFCYTLASFHKSHLMSIEYPVPSVSPGESISSL